MAEMPKRNLVLLADANCSKLSPLRSAFGGHVIGSTATARPILGADSGEV